MGTTAEVSSAHAIYGTPKEIVKLKVVFYRKRVEDLDDLAERGLAADTARTMRNLSWCLTDKGYIVRCDVKADLPAREVILRLDDEDDDMGNFNWLRKRHSRRFVHGDAIKVQLYQNRHQEWCCRLPRID